MYKNFFTKNSSNDIPKSVSTKRKNYTFDEFLPLAADFWEADIFFLPLGIEDLTES